MAERGWSPAQWSDTTLRRLHLAMLGIVCLLAALLRLYALNRLPPGLFTDEAFNGLTASHILDAGDLRPFYAANAGREPLYFLLLAVAIRLGGHTALTLRSISAVVGTLTAPLTYLVLREFFAGERHARWLALLAAGTLAVSYWHLNFSRIAFRAILLPPCALLTLGTFLRAWRRGALRDFALAGLLLGLSLYTYLAARLLPLLLLAFAALEAINVWWRWRRVRGAGQAGSNWGRRAAVRRIGGMVLLFVVAIVVLWPLMAYFASHPGTFSSRMSNVLILTAQDVENQGTSVERLLRNAVKLGRMFYDRGDSNPRHGVPNRPVLDPLAAALFSVGLLVTMTRLDRAAYRLLLLWLGVMLLPVLLTSEAPNSLRGIGALPAVCALVGVGSVWLAERLARWTPARFEVWVELCLLLLLASSGGATAHSYFVRWPRVHDVTSAFDDQWRRIAEAIEELTATSDLYLPMELFTQPVVRYLLYERYPCLVTPSQPIDLDGLHEPRALFLLERSHQGPFVLLTGAGKRMARSLQPMTRDEWKAFAAAVAPRVASADKIVNGQSHDMAVVLQLSPADLALLPRENGPAYPLERRFANGVRLRGYSLEPDVVTPGGHFNLTLFWQTERLPEADVVAFVHLMDRAGDVWSQANGPPTAGFHPAALWSLNEIVPDVRTVMVPLTLPEGKVRFEVGLLAPNLHDRVPVVNEAGDEVADQVLLGASVITSYPNTGSKPAHLLDVRFDPSLLLVGYDLAGEARPGGSLRLTLHWQALDRVDADYTVFAHLVDAAGSLVAQRDQQPQGGDNPTSWWVPGEKIMDQTTLAMPTDVPPGQYSLHLGLYDLGSGQRLPCWYSSGAAGGDHVTIPVFIVEAGHD
ncbi:MAG: glycosyltransferase family 39 protein [Ardenticatenia bacterium]|nr:glycosyltransferase family 39 protein [Ardenticatenia bacterium]